LKTARSTHTRVERLQRWKAVSVNLGIFARADFLLFTAARVIGIGIRPLILYLAATRGFAEFSDAFALFATSVAGSFIVFSNEAHIRLYKAEFNSNSNILKLFLATRYFVINAVSHVIWFSAGGAALLYLWTGNLWLSAFGLVVLFAEKIYDEFQRYYTFQRAYIKWTIGFAFRYGLPGLAVLIPIVVGYPPTLALYVAAYIIACLVYVAIWERKTIAFHTRLYAHYWQGGRVLVGYIRTYARDLYANQAWAFIGGNLYLLDRIMINQTPVSIGAYVFFCNLFNLAVFTHTTLYFVHRRPDLIGERASLLHEFSRIPNIAPPALYTLGVVGICSFLIIYQPAYADFDITLVLGLACYFYAQAVSLVVLDFIFWRVRRERLVLVDLAVAATLLASFFAFRLHSTAIPLLMALLVVMRVLAYSLLWRSTESRAPSA